MKQTAIQKLKNWIERWNRPNWQSDLANAGGTDSEPEYHIAIAIERMFQGEGFKARRADGWELFSGHSVVAVRLNGRMFSLSRIVDKLTVSELSEAKRLLSNEFWKIDWD